MEEGEKAGRTDGWGRDGMGWGWGWDKTSSLLRHPWEAKPHSSAADEMQVKGKVSFFRATRPRKHAAKQPRCS